MIVCARRQLYEQAPLTINREHNPGVVLPIVLTRADLSAPLFDDAHHPTRWTQPGDGLVGLAFESCRRNLGLIELLNGPVLILGAVTALVVAAT
jgi:hypothetical protein